MNWLYDFCLVTLGVLIGLALTDLLPGLIP